MAQRLEATKAFEELRRSLEVHCEAVQREIVEATKKKRFDEAARLAGSAKEVERFVGDVKRLMARWSRFAAERSATRSRAARAKSVERPRAQRLPRGVGLGEDQFKRPILEILERHGGRAPKSVVLAEIEQLMGHQFRPVDWEPLPSDPRRLRWSNKVEWARNSLREQGLIEEVRQPGIWEISEAGRSWLLDHR
jgi:hypothetical protein